MLITDFIPTFLLNVYRKVKISQNWGGYGRRVKTFSIHPTVKLGKGVYLAKETDIRSNVTINDYSYCSQGTIVFNGTQIGKFCSIGYNTQIGLPEHPINFLSTSPTIYRGNLSQKANWPKDDYTSPSIIGNDVWIGSNVMILQGVHIDNGAVIAAGTVVTKDVPAYAIVGGVPAKVIKYRFDEKHIKELLESQWWDRDFTWIDEHYKELMGDEQDNKNCSFSTN